MKAKRVVLLILIVMIVICKSNIVYGRHVADLDIELETDKNITGIWADSDKTGAEQEKGIVNFLKEYLNYSAEEEHVKDKMKFDTSIKITKKNFKFFSEQKYTIQIGNDGEHNITKEVTEKELKEIYGCNDVNQKNVPWKVVLIVSCSTEKVNAYDSVTVTEYRFKIKEIYNSYETDNYTEGQKAIVEGTEIKEPFTSGDLNVGIETAKNVVEKYNDFMKKFGADQGNTIAEAICNFFTVIADIFQVLLNKIQTLGDGIPGLDFSVKYTYNELIGDESVSQASSTDLDNKSEESKTDYSVLNKYTKVGEYSSDNSQNQKRLIYIDNKIDKFTTKTEIPVIPTEIYGIAFEKIDIFSVDFLNVNQKENKSDVWNFIRKIFSIITHGVLYISIAILLSMLIYHGINIIKSQNDNPSNRVTHIQGLYRFIKSLVILTAIVVFMALCITLTNYLIKIIRGNKILTDDQLPIRVNVNNVYSFSTNVTGYFRFMAQSENIPRRVGFIFKYIIMVVLNIITSFLMIYRMIKMWVLGIIGPLIASLHALNLQENLKLGLTLRDWAKQYAMLASVQLIIVCMYEIIEYAMLN